MRATSMAWGLIGLALAGCGDSSRGSGGEGGAGVTGAGGSGPGSGSGGAGGQSTSTGAGGGPSFVYETRVDVDGGGVAGSAHLAIAPNGTLYVSWVAADDVLVAVSTDGGESFGPPVHVDGSSTVPIVRKGELPFVVADDARVAVAFNDQSGEVVAFVSAAGEPLSFDQGSYIGHDTSSPYREFPSPVLLSDGSLAVAWHGLDNAFFSRESEGWATTSLSSGAPGVPCECCPIEVRTAAAGETMAAFRNNDGNLREMWAAKGSAAGDFAAWAPASTTEGMIFSCPVEGPKLAETSEGAHWMVWSARGRQDVGAVHASISNDGGASWSGGAPLGQLVGDQPSLAIGPSGRIYVTAATATSESALSWSDDGSAWSPPAPLAVADGTVTRPQSEGAAGIAAIAGVSSGGSVWLLRTE